MRKLLALLLCCLPAVSHAWWNEEWNFRKEITLDLTPAGANITGTPQEVPVLLRLSLGNFGYFADTKPDGSDLRVIAGDDKTPLKFHIERYDATNQLAFVWVRVQRLAGGTNTEKIFLYYGNPKAPAAGDAGSTYDANQTLVYHFSGEQITDSTSYGNKPSGGNASLNAASLIGGGLKLAGESVTVPSSASLRIVPKQGATLSSWIRIDGPQSDARILSFEDQNNALTLGVNGTALVARVQRGTATVATAQSGEVLVAGQWHHVAVTIAAGRMTLYVDGVEVAGTPAEVPEIAGTLTIGSAASGSNAFNGELDELQISNVPRGAEWIQAAARSQGQEAPLVVYGNDAQREGEKVSYFKVTMQNVTADGWVVIIVLAVMFVIALLVMIFKAVHLIKVQKANGKFLEAFAALRTQPRSVFDQAADGTSPPFVLMPSFGDQQDKYRNATIYRLYQNGWEEMTGRVGHSVGASAVNSLSPQAIEAIRATMDASLVRMQQKLASQMVLLTIAISGGPFLGLLGTVVGVMITFAAIAASGDVNVNSIAPGIAAALAATVAGLAVAIPSLFGYNWLNTKIKEITADMRVFVDEFVTRVAEHYS